MDCIECKESIRDGEEFERACDSGYCESAIFCGEECFQSHEDRRSYCIGCESWLCEGCMYPYGRKEVCHDDLYDTHFRCSECGDKEMLTALIASIRKERDAAVAKAEKAEERALNAESRIERLEQELDRIREPSRKRKRRKVLLV